MNVDVASLTEVLAVVYACGQTNEPSEMLVKPPFNAIISCLHQVVISGDTQRKFVEIL